MDGRLAGATSLRLRNFIQFDVDLLRAIKVPTYTNTLVFNQGVT